MDLRSDTVTQPTPEMRKAMYEAEVGDDVLHEDPTINALEAYAAELIGKESALFVPSGTFGNQLALFAHCKRGSEVILSEQSHIVQHETGAAAIIAGVQLRTLSPVHGFLTWKEIDPHIRRGEDIHYPETGLIALENALSNGDVMPSEEMKGIFDHARELEIPIHLDGARIFNAALYLGVEASVIAGLSHSVMFCLSKGLCAPVGSMLAGDRDFIRKARKGRKIMGGGMRQAGFLAAAGLISLKKMVHRLHEDRQKADILAKVFRKLRIFEIKPEEVKINMFFVRFKCDSYAGLENSLAEALKKHNVLIYPRMGGWLRFVTHHDISFEEVEMFGGILEESMAEITI